MKISKARSDFTLPLTVRAIAISLRAFALFGVRTLTDYVKLSAVSLNSEVPFQRAGLWAASSTSVKFVSVPSRT